MKRIFGTVFLFICFAAFVQGQNLTLGGTSTNVPTPGFDGVTYTYVIPESTNVTITPAEITALMNAATNSGNVRIEVPGNVYSSTNIEIRNSAQPEKKTFTIVAGGDILISHYIQMGSLSGYNAHNLVLDANGKIYINHNGTAVVNSQSIYIAGEGGARTGAASAACGGDVTLTTKTGDIVFYGNDARINASGAASTIGGVKGGNGGKVTITAGRDFIIDLSGNFISTFGNSGSGAGNGGNGGNVTITAGRNIVNEKAFVINAYGGATNNGGNGGNITLSAPAGYVKWGGALSSYSQVAVALAGNVSIYGENGVTIGGVINAYANSSDNTANINNWGKLTVECNTSDLPANFAVTNINAGIIANNAIRVNEFIKKGQGTLVISGQNVNYLKGPTIIKEGMLLLKTANAIAKNYNTVLDGATLGIDYVNANDVGTGRLLITDNGGGIYFGSGCNSSSGIKYSAYQNLDWDANAKLKITGWSAASLGITGGKGKFYVGATATSLPTDQLAQVLFINPIGNGKNYDGKILGSTGEVIPNAVVPFIDQPKISLGIDGVAGTLLDAATVVTGSPYTANTLTLGGGAQINDYTTTAEVVARLNYKITNEAGTTTVVPASYITLSNVSTAATSGVWEVAAAAVDVSALAPGNYKVHVWYSATVGSVTISDDNDGDNYVFTITKPVPAVPATEICAVRNGSQIQISLLPANTIDYITTINATDYSSEATKTKSISQAALPMTVEIHTSNGLKLIKKFW